MKQKRLNTWQATWQLIKQQPIAFLINALMWGIAHSALLWSGLAAREVFNYLTEGSAQGVGAGWNLPSLLALLVGIGIGRFAINLTALGVYSRYHMVIVGVLRLNMIREILRRPGADAIRTSPGEALSRFRGDVERIINFATDWVVDLLGFGAGAAIGLVVLYRVQPTITLTILVPLILLVVMTNLMRHRLETYRNEARTAAGRVTGFIGEMYGAVQAVKVAHAREGVNREFARLNTLREKAEIKDSLFKKLLDTGFEGTIEISTGIILLLAGQQLGNDSFTVGDFALFISYLVPITDGLMYLGNMLAVQKQTDVSLQKIEDLLRSDKQGVLVAETAVPLSGTFPPIAQPSWNPQYSLHELRLQHVSYQYPQSDKGIENINLRIRRGEFVVITGRIGSGKTTLLRVLLGLLPIDSGQVCWNEQDVTAQRDNFFVPPMSAYTGQVPRLFSDTLAQNIRLGLEMTDEEIAGAIETAVMEQDLQTLEKGLQTVVGPRGVKLSGGQIQRTATARMFARSAQLYVFDDLSSALDVKTEKVLWERLFGRAEKPTCLVVSHRHEVLRRADHIILMQEGQIADEGSLEELLARSNEMQALWQQS